MDVCFTTLIEKVLKKNTLYVLCISDKEKVATSYEKKTNMLQIMRKEPGVS